MKNAKHLVPGFLLLIGATVAPAAAQSLDVTGAWSWQSPDPQRGGPDVNTLLINQNGSYVRVSRAPNGWMLRYEGVYRTAITGADQVTLQSHVNAWYPSAMCSEMPQRGIRNCGAVPHPPDGTVVLQVLSPTTMLLGGMRLFRDPNPTLLSAQVPAQMTQQLAAAPMPVMPTLHPYTTPHGPGLATSEAAHEGAQNFINGYLRGCNKDENGRLWGCEQ